MSSDEEVSILADSIAHLLSFCGPLRVSCVDGKKTETYKISGWREEEAKRKAKEMILFFLEKKKLISR